MESVRVSGFFQSYFVRFEASSIPVIFSTSIFLSQFISNVPLVALYLPLLQQQGAGLVELVALAAGSTIAGNLFVLGAASNVIIIQNAEERGVYISFLDFAKIGVLVTLVNFLVYWAFISLF